MRKLSPSFTYTARSVFEYGDESEFLTEKLLELIQTSKFFSDEARISGNFTS